jgi:hypothetical protein
MTTTKGYRNLETIEKNGTTYVLVPQDAWNKIASGEMEMPTMPAADAQGRMPALEAVRVVIARVTPDERTMNRIDKALKPSAKIKSAKVTRAKKLAGK